MRFHGAGVVVGAGLVWASLLVAAYVSVAATCQAEEPLTLPQRFAEVVLNVEGMT